MRDELVTGFLPLVRRAAHRYRWRGESPRDLEQVGCIGLIKALDRFDPARGVPFPAFAVPTIVGEIQRYFRDDAWAMKVPRTVKDLVGPIRDAVADLSAVTGTAPRPSEIAAVLGVRVPVVVDGLAAAHAYSLDSLDEAALSDPAVRRSQTEDLEGVLRSVEDSDTVRTLLRRLSDVERQVVALRFLGEWTQTEIGQKLGISQMQVSRLLARSLERLRSPAG